MGKPTGFKEFNLAPYLPEEWNHMCLNNVRAFDSNFDVCVRRKIDDFEITIDRGKNKISTIKWDGNSPVSYSFN